MTKRNIYTYLKNHQDDDYILSVVYYCLRVAIINYVFKGHGLLYFNVSKRYISEKRQLTLNPVDVKPTDAFGVLLSIRAIMLDHDNLNYCSDDRLIFCKYGKQEFGWIDYAHLIYQYNEDDEFNLILRILSNLADGYEIDEEDKKEFINQTQSPECRNIYNYYRDKERDQNQEVDKSDMICGCSHIYDNTIENFTVGEEISYIGNTAFAYCERLISITFLTHEIYFGKFPIVECNNLEHIYVPKGLKEYYAERLPYYYNIITEMEEPIQNNVVEKAEEKESETEIINDINRSSQCVEVVKEENPIGDELASEDSQGPKRGKRQRIKIVPKKVVNLIDKGINIIKSSKSNSPRLDESYTYGLRTKKIKNSFNKKFTTYKYFWALALLNLLKKHNYEGTIGISELTSEMIVQSWEWVKNRKASFPAGDQIPSIVEVIDCRYESYEDNEIRDIINQEMVEDPVISRKINNLSKNAPYRFLSPWISFSTEIDVTHRSQEYENDCPYAVDKDGVTINPEWKNYFERNSDLLKLYIEAELTDYLGIEQQEEDIDELSEEEQEVRKYLIDNYAGTKNNLSYTELIREMNLDYNMNDEIDYSIVLETIENITRFEVEHDRPMLSAVIIKKRDMMPGRGFFKIAEDLGFGKAVELKKNGFWEEERQRLYDYWK